MYYINVSYVELHTCFNVMANLQERNLKKIKMFGENNFYLLSLISAIALNRNRTYIRTYE